MIDDGVLKRAEMIARKALSTPGITTKDILADANLRLRDGKDHETA